jgi:hypothetical protein
LKSSRGRDCLTPLSSARGRPFFTGAVTKLKSNAKFKAAFMAMPKAKREAMMKPYAEFCAELNALAGS